MVEWCPNICYKVNNCVYYNNKYYKSISKMNTSVPGDFKNFILYVIIWNNN
jgi:hypothetical protein